MIGTEAAAFRVDPYPGRRPPWSFVLVGARVVRLGSRQQEGGWQVGDRTQHTFDEWLSASGAVPMSDRVPVLSYGSNACPSKLVYMRSREGLPGPVVMTRCVVDGLAATWCTRPRQDGVITATLTTHPGEEQHFLWWVAPDQWEALDSCEGRHSKVYDLVELTLGAGASVRDEDGNLLPNVFAYVGAAQSRHPRLNDRAAPLLVRDRQDHPDLGGLSGLRPPQTPGTTP